MKYSCEISTQMQKELNQTTKLWSIISLIIGSVGLACYVALSMFYEGSFMTVLLCASSILFAFGIVFLFSVSSSNKKAAEMKLAGEYELEPEYIMVTTFKNGENIGTMKIYYKDFVKIKETENYLFLFPNPQMAYPVPKDKLTKEEIAQLKSWLDQAKIKRG